MDLGHPIVVLPLMFPASCVMQVRGRPKPVALQRPRVFLATSGHFRPLMELHLHLLVLVASLALGDPLPPVRVLIVAWVHGLLLLEQLRTVSVSLVRREHRRW